MFLMRCTFASEMESWFVTLRLQFFQAVVDPESHCFYVRWVQAGISMIAHSYLYVRSMDRHRDVGPLISLRVVFKAKWRHACGFCAGVTVLLFLFSPRVVFVRQGHLVCFLSLFSRSKDVLVTDGMAIYC